MSDPRTVQDGMAYVTTPQEGVEREDGVALPGVARPSSLWCGGRRQLLQGYAPPRPARRVGRAAPGLQVSR